MNSFKKEEEGVQLKRIKKKSMDTMIEEEVLKRCNYTKNDNKLHPSWIDKIKLDLKRKELIKSGKKGTHIKF